MPVPIQPLTARYQFLVFFHSLQSSYLKTLTWKILSAARLPVIMPLSASLCPSQPPFSPSITPVGPFHSLADLWQSFRQCPVDFEQLPVSLSGTTVSLLSVSQWPLTVLLSVFLWPLLAFYQSHENTFQPLSPQWKSNWDRCWFCVNLLKTTTTLCKLSLTSDRPFVCFSFTADSPLSAPTAVSSSTILYLICDRHLPVVLWPVTAPCQPLWPRPAPFLALCDPWQPTLLVNLQ